MKRTPPAKGGARPATASQKAHGRQACVSADACFLVALATQINDDAFFRALLEQCGPLLTFPFEPDALAGFAEAVNSLLGGRELWVEQRNKNIALLKNERGLVIKLERRGTAAAVDSYYSYPARFPAGEETFAIGKTAFCSSLQTMRRLAGHVSDGAAQARGKPSAAPWEDKGWQRAQRRACTKAIVATAQVAAAKKAVQKDRGALARLKTADVLAVIFCYLLGTFLVQAACLWFLGRLVLTFMAFFFCGFVGMLLYYVAGEVLLPLVIPRYRKKLRYGEDGHGGNFFALSYASNIALYLVSLFFVQLNVLKIVELLLGVIFTFYSMHYLVNILFAMKRNVLRINAGKTPLNVRYYSNTVLPAFSAQDMPAVTISLTVYTEDNGVIFGTMRQAMAAVADYRLRAGAPANLVVSDDGFFKFLNGMTSPEAIEHYLKRQAEGDPTLTEKERVILERIVFYRENNITFVARPMPERPGKFKKAGNLNYTNRLARHLAEGHTRQQALAVGGAFYGGYFEGDVTMGDIILVLDKDSGLHPGILYATVPEFINDPKLAYTQHKTMSANTGVNYFTKGMSAFLNTLFNTHLPNKALQGLIVPLMGHNAFVRKAFIEESGGWAENRVAEDFSKSLDAYRLGYHGKFIAYKGLEFREHVCQTFAEETDKQYRYCYGIMEMVFKDFKKHAGHYLLGRPYDNAACQRLKPFQMMDILTYFLSYINLAASVPTALFIISGTYIHILYGGILINLVIYYLCPVLQSLIFRLTSGDRAVKASPLNYAVINFNFFGHSYSVLKGIISLAVDCLRSTYEPFAASSVDDIEKSFANGVRMIARYSVRNLPYTGAALVLAAKGVSLLLSGNLAPTVVIPAVYLISFVLPILLLTPQLFCSPFRARKASAPKARAKAAEMAERAEAP